MPRRMPLPRCGFAAFIATLARQQGLPASRIRRLVRGLSRAPIVARATS